MGGVSSSSRGEIEKFMHIQTDVRIWEGHDLCATTGILWEESVSVVSVVVEEHDEIGKCVGSG